MKAKCLTVFLLPFYFLLFTFVLGLGWSSAWAQNVEITPLGSHTGEFCRNDRALLFEDPTGLRILYDPGRSVAGAGDARLGTVHVMILSSVHADHIGDVKATAVDAGTCASPTTTSAAPNSNFAEIAAAKNSIVIVGGEMHDYLTEKIKDAGDATPDVRILRHGGKRTVGGVTFAIVAAHHANGVPRSLLDAGLAASLAPDGLTAYVGPENGFVLSFTNGLVVYLSADTGHTSDMATIVKDFYKAKLAVVNMGDIFSMGPEEAAFAVKRLIKPKSVIPSHANEAATTGGVVNAGTRTERFDQLVTGIPVHVPLSGVTMEFNSNGQCVAGC